MPYATLQDLIDRFGENELITLTDRADPLTGEIDAEVVAMALGDADAMIDGYIGSRYGLPLSQIPPLLVGVASDLARYQLYNEQPTETVSTRRDQAVAVLRDIASGKLALPVGETETPASSSIGVTVEGSDRVFSDDALKDY